jgi:hypothetical protein
MRSHRERMSGCRCDLDSVSNSHVSGQKSQVPLPRAMSVLQRLAAMSLFRIEFQLGYFTVNTAKLSCGMVASSRSSLASYNAERLIERTDI